MTRVGGYLIHHDFSAVLLGLVLLDIGNYPAVKVAQSHAGVRAGYAQMGSPLNVFPVGFQFVLVPQFIKHGV